MIRFSLEDPRDGELLVAALLAQADRDETERFTGRPTRAPKLRELADRIGDALEELPVPGPAAPEPRELGAVERRHQLADGIRSGSIAVAG